MSDLRPGAVETVERIGQRLHKRIPGRRSGRGRDALYRGAGLAEQRSQCGRNMLGSDVGEARQAGKIKQRIDLGDLCNGIHRRTFSLGGAVS
jgi:hypothetical protein